MTFSTAIGLLWYAELFLLVVIFLISLYSPEGRRSGRKKNKKKDDIY